MSNLDITQRNAYERANLNDLSFRLTRRGQRIYTLFFVALIGVLGALTYAAVERFDGWHHAIVLGDMLIVAYGVSRWVYTPRKNIG